MANHSDIIADGWVNILIQGVLILCLLDGTKKSLGFGHGLALVQLCLSLLLLSDDSLVLAVSSIVETNEALCNLEEVLVWLIWAKVSNKVERVVGFNGFDIWSDLEGVCAPLLSDLVIDLKEGPVNIDREGELILNVQSS